MLMAALPRLCVLSKLSPAIAQFCAQKVSRDFTAADYVAAVRGLAIAWSRGVDAKLHVLFTQMLLDMTEHAPRVLLFVFDANGLELLGAIFRGSQVEAAVHNVVMNLQQVFIFTFAFCVEWMCKYV